LNNKKREKESALKKANINDKNGLNISYDKKELERFMPNLITEISEKEKSLKIDAVNYQAEKVDKTSVQISQSCIPDELINPGAIDFIRRCTNDEQAFEILEYLLKRKEISVKDYERYKNQILQEDGLRKLIADSGGIKKPGYYERKYYKKEFDKLKFKK